MKKEKDNHTLFLYIRNSLLQIDASFEGEIYFPTVNFNDWVLLKKEEHLKDEKNQYDYRFLVLERKLSL